MALVTKMTPGSTGWIVTLDCGHERSFAHQPTYSGVRCFTCEAEGEIRRAPIVTIEFKPEPAQVARVCDYVGCSDEANFQAKAIGKPALSACYAHLGTMVDILWDDGASGVHVSHVRDDGGSR